MPCDGRNGQIKYIQLWLDEWQAMQLRLSQPAFGPWCALVIEQARRQEPLPDDNKMLARIAGLSAARWRKIRPELEALVEGSLEQMTPEDDGGQ